MRSLVATVCVVLIAGACAPPGGAPSDGRATAIRSAREVLGDAIGQLGAAVLETDEAVTGVRLGDPPDPAERGAEIAAIRDGALARLDAALQATAEVDLTGSDPAVEAALAAWGEARTAAGELAAAARADLDHTERLSATDVTLAEIVESWAVPGSYTQQLERFTNLRNRARSEASHLAQVEPRPACSEGVGRRRDAATWVATSTEELRALVEARQGERFDARRQELTASVYGLGEAPGDARTVLGRLDARDRDCWSAHAETSTAADRFEAAVEDIEAALNPGDMDG